MLATTVGWIGFLTVILALGLAFAPPAGRNYISPDGSFELRVPPGYGVHTGKDKLNQSYIPVCHDDSLVCITFPSGRYEGTNFEDAAIEVSVLEPKTPQACLNPGKYEMSTSPNAEFRVDAKHPSRVIDGTRFLHAVVGGAAMSHDVAANLYRGYKNGKCYQLSIRVAFSNFAVYRPGAIREFTTQDQGDVCRLLTRILDSFKSLH